MRAAALGALVALGLGGCAGILGIPSDVDRSESDGGSADSAAADVTLDTAPSVDAGTDRDATVLADADADAPPACDLTKDFGPPVMLTTLSTTEQEGSPRFSEDELTVYFDGIRAATGEPYFGLLMATRTSITDSFGPAVPIPGDVNTPDNHEFAPNVTPDGLTIFFERQDTAFLDDNFWTASRPDTNSPFTGSAQISGINTPEYEGKLFVRNDANELYFVKNVGGGNFDVHVAKKVQGNYVITQLANVNSSAGEYAPVVSKNGLVLYFSSQRTVAGKNDENIWVATRAKTTDDFGPPAYVTNVNQPGSAEEPGWISNDGCRLYFTSNRAGGAGQQDIYVATRPK